MKHTAVEQLQVNLSISLGRDIMIMLFNEFEKAKEMEKEQIIDCYDFVSSKICTQCDDFKTGEQYYNETFKQQ
jgi:hypothetical protein